MKRIDAESETLIACEVADSLTVGGNQTTGFTGDCVAMPPPMGFMWQSGLGGSFEEEGMGTLIKNQTPAVAFAQNQQDEIREMSVAGALASEPGMKQQTYIKQHLAVRRLTPRECERLQGFPDDWTLVPVKKVNRNRLKSPKTEKYIEINGEVWQLAADGPRYKALGNSMATTVMAWLGRRIQATR